MKRVFYIDTTTAERRLEESDFPLTIGGYGSDITLPDLPAKTVLAHIALSDGHAYIQPDDESVELFHNHEHITSSTWLKSGDRLQLEQQVLRWDVKGDQVFIRLRPMADEPQLEPPPEPPPETEAVPDEEIIPVGPPAKPQSSHRRLRYTLLTLFGLLSLIALFVLFATPMAISVSPEPESRSVGGFPPPVSLGQKMLVVPGSYTLHASREGYQTLEQEFEVASGGFQSFNFELQELPGRLQITVDPVVPIRVFDADMETVTETDNIFPVERGLRQLRIETDRYLPETRELEIQGFGKLQQLNISLQAAWANVQLDSEPQGAVVRVDDDVVGTTPLFTEIIQGERNIELSLEGFKTVQLLRSFMAGDTPGPETIYLEPNDGTLILESQPSGATVSIDGTFQGTTPLSITLASKITHNVRLSEPGYSTTEKAVSLEPDQEQTLVIDLPPRFGVVFVRSIPADALLALDGKLSGSGTQRLRLTTRPHELTFSKPGYVSQTVSVTPRMDTSQTIDIRLKTLAQAKEEARPALLRTAAGQEMPLLEPKGSFQMGASRREAGRRANESQRLVELTRPFYLASKEVSNAEYRQFKSSHNSGSAEGVSLNDDNKPVVKVSWDDAARYCNWLSERDRLSPAYAEQDGHMILITPVKTGYRLPTEAEWAYAARVSNREDAARYPWGEGYPPATAAGNFADAQIADTLANVVNGYNDGYRGPAPVGSFSMFPTGFHDLGGNVAEWTNDYYAVYPGQVEKLVKDPTGPSTGDHHVVRGSSWRDGSITELRLSYRDYSRGPRDNLGFRIARYADE